MLTLMLTLMLRLITVICRSYIRFTVKVLKRHLRIETPVYRHWWKVRSEANQRLLNIAAEKRESRQLFQPYPTF